MMGSQSFLGDMQNLHTHTTFCDGALTPEEMVQAAISRGYGSLGFSEHSSVATVVEIYAMSTDTTLEYIEEINALKEKYKEKIEIFLGIEQDIFTESCPEGLDYIIGTVHHVKKEGGILTVDAGPKSQKKMVDAFFGGDYYSMAESYFATVAEVVNKTNATIVGHFDLVTKYNFDGSQFDQTHRRYIYSALDAMDEILKRCNLFEVNTGAMYRLRKPEPYPSVFFLKELLKRGGEVILSSDSHDAESLCYKFDEMRELLKTLGFKYMKRLTQSGFIDVRL